MGMAAVQPVRMVQVVPAAAPVEVEALVEVDAEVVVTRLVRSAAYSGASVQIVP